MKVSTLIPEYSNDVLDEILDVSNNSSNSSFKNPLNSPNYSVIFSTLIISCYCIIFLLGLIGNSLVVFVVCNNKSMQSVTNVFITNLAVSDIFMCLLCVPFTPISFFMANWPFGKFLCHLVPFSLGVCVYVSTLTSLAIAIDRYFVIVHPFKPRMKLGVCLLLIAVVWVVSISISLPLAIYYKYTSGSSTEPSYCMVSLSSVVILAFLFKKMLFF
jgi:neuropeptide Y receptor